MTKWDVGVVGAGPAGSYTAYLLAKSGLRVLLLEEHATVGDPRHCTGILGREAFDHFPDLPQAPIQSELPATWIVSPMGRRVRTDWYQGQAVIMDRARFDRELAAMASRAGAELQTGSRVVRIERDAQGATLTMETGGERSGPVRCRAVVLAGGISYRLHPQLNLDPPARHLVCAQTEVESDDIREVEVYIGRSVAPGSFAWAVPMGNGRLRIGITAYQQAGRCLEALLSGPFLKDRIWRSGAPIQKRPVPIGPVRCSATERVLVVGDAAGQVKPTTGGGVYYGLIGASAAAETLQEAFGCGRFDQRFLSSYDRRWKSRLRRELWLGRAMRKAFECLSDEKLDTLVRVCGQPAVARLMQGHSNFDWHSGNVASFLTSRPVLAQLFTLPLWRALGSAGPRR